jgi:excisionase family DNA binding protein
MFVLLLPMPPVLRLPGSVRGLSADCRRGRSVLPGRGTPRTYPDRMTTNEAAKELGYVNTTYVERLIRAGTLRATKVGGRWDVDGGSVAAYTARVSAKRSSRSHAAAERERRKRAAAARFAT